MICGAQLIQQRLAGANLRIFTVPCLADNYAWVIQDVATGALGVVDTPAGKPILAQIEKLGLPSDSGDFHRLTILNTHHHKDHTGGNQLIKDALGAYVVGPSKEKISAIDKPLVEGDIVRIGASTCRVIDLPGHTCGHIGYVFDDPGVVFVGDTMFSHGCGALFEGSPAQMWKSLTKIMSLPESTLVFCAHEYTQANVMFGINLFPDHHELRDIHAQVKSLRERGEQTVPSLLAQELRTNPFLRCRLPEVQLELKKSTALEAFTYVRTNKDAWRSL